MQKANIDPAEIDKFSDIAAKWWDTEGDLRTLHAINPLRLGFINQFVSLKDKKVIDVGCGGGILSESMAKQGADVTGIDMSQSALKVAKLHQLKSGLTLQYQQITAEEMASCHEGTFDVVTCLEMLEHVPDPQSVITACAKLAKPNANLFFSTLNRNVQSYLYAIVGAEYLLKLLPKNTHDFAKFIRPSELTAWARQAGLSIQNITGIQYNPFTKRYALSKDIQVNYLIHFVKK